VLHCVARARAADRGPGLRKGTEDHEPCRHNRNAGAEADALERIPNGEEIRLPDMEGSMDNNGSRPSEKPELPTELKLENTLDTSGMWFAAAVLFAVLAAGIIIYRAANDDIRTAANDTLAAPASSSR